MTADQIRSLQPELAALLETYLPKWRITLEQVAKATNPLAWAIWQRMWRSSDEIAARCT